VKPWKPKSAEQMWGIGQTRDAGFRDMLSRRYPGECVQLRDKCSNAWILGEIQSHESEQLKEDAYIWNWV
jgi:hypothetical protein